MTKKRNLFFQILIPYFSLLINLIYYNNNQSFDAFTYSYNNLKILNIIIILTIGFLITIYCFMNSNQTKKKLTILLCAGHIVCFTILLIIPYMSFIKGNLFYFLINSYQFISLWIGVNLTILVNSLLEKYKKKKL
jgi:hypothetical protein